MTPFDRLYTAMSGGAPDRVPVMPKIWVDLAGRLTATSFTKILSDPFLALRVIVDAGLKVGADAVRQFHFPARLVEQVEDQIYEIDKNGQKIGEIDIAGGWTTQLLDPSTFKLGDPFYMAYSQYWPSCDSPHVRDLADARRIAIPAKSFYEQIGCGDRQRRIMDQADNRIALAGDLTSATMAFYVVMRGLTSAMFDLIENPELVHAVMDKGVAIVIERGKFLIDLGLKVLRLNDSVGNMSVISPACWRQFVLPRLKAICQELHEYDRSVRIYCHICGNVLPILDELVETGLDCIGPLDPLGGMRAAEVRARVGNSVGLMGGVNTLTLLKGTPAEIRREAEECIRAAGEFGGYILGSGCVVPRDTPEGNLTALCQGATQFGRYPSAGRLRQD